MSTVLTTAVAIGFLWSVVLFFAAVFVRDRQQETGFGWALAGAVLFAVVFSDRLPGHSTDLRSVLTVLPGVDDGAELFASSLAAVVLLFVVYLLRVVLFYQFFIAPESGGMTPATAPEDGDEEIVNDLVAPSLSYFCFAVCVVSLVQPLYDLSVLWTVVLSIGLLVLYYWSIPQIVAISRELGPLARVAATEASVLVRSSLWFLVERIAEMEMRRRDLPPERLRRINARTRGLEDRKRRARADRARVMRRIAASRRRQAGRRRRRRRRGDE